MNRLAATLVLVIGIAIWSAAAQLAESAHRKIMTIEIAGPIGPATAHFIEQAIAEAETANAEALIINLDTPGGLSDSMRSIIRSILQSETPIVTYVAPPGSRAASAGTFILYSSHIAAMSPGTNVGAATPVMIGGDLPQVDRNARDRSEDQISDEDQATGAPPASSGAGQIDKAMNDAIAYIRSLAEYHGRNADWAEQAVRTGDSLTATQALNLGVIDLIAVDQDDLLQAIDGRVVTTVNGERTIQSASATIYEIRPSTINQVLAIISNPNAAFILMLIGVYGILLEFYNPGSIGPGVFGAVCLVLGLYALNQLPLSYAGAALVLLGLGFMIAEALDPSFGILGLGGVVAFVLGAILLVDTEIPEYRISWWTIGAMAVLTGSFFIWLIGSIYSSRSRPLATGIRGMLNETATVIDWSGGRGHVLVLGERWRASGKGTYSPGQNVEITDVRDLEIIVAPRQPKNEKE